MGDEIEYGSDFGNDMFWISSWQLVAPLQPFWMALEKGRGALRESPGLTSGRDCFDGTQVLPVQDGGISFVSSREQIHGIDIAYGVFIWQQITNIQRKC